MDLFKVKTAEDIAKAYAQAGVSQKRIEGLENKFQTIPDNFKIEGLCFPKLKIGDKTVVVPSFALDTKATRTIPVGQLFASHVGNTPTASEIQKADSAYKGKFLVVNKERVNKLAEGLSEAEFITAVTGKKFKANPAQDFQVYTGFNDKGELTFHNTPEEAIEKGITVKSYRTIVAE